MKFWRLLLFPYSVLKGLDALAATLDRMEKKMATQADIDQLTQTVTAIGADLQTQGTAIQTDIANIQAEIADLQQANPSLDLSALQAAVASLQTNQQAVDTQVAALGQIAPAGSGAQ